MLSMTIYYKSAAVFLAGTFSSLAAISVPAFFSDGMVLQRETGAKIWGTGDPNTSVKAQFAGQKLTSKTDADGKWMVDFKGLKMSKAGAALQVNIGKDTLIIKDVVVGEVWLASGQSNMEWTMRRTSGAEDAKTAKDDLLRIYVSGNSTAAKPQTDFKGSWKKTDPANTPNFTAVGYEFAKNLRAKLDVPVGVIECSWGGKPVESFVSEEALKVLPEAKIVLDKKANQLKRWKQMLEKNPKANPKQNPELNPGMHSTIYNAMIAPLAGYGARGAIWYQGESNARGGTATHYGELLKCLIDDWRKKWGSDLSFYYVQLANFDGKNNFPHWVMVQDEMRRLLDESPKVGMAVINDIGAAKNIHPKNKKDVGARLARWALSKDYGVKDMVISGPLYKSHEIKGANVEVSFSHAEGLKSRAGNPLGGFEVSDESGKWHPAEAVVKGDKIIVTSKAAAHPSNVRYAWKSNPTKANLVNKAGLPTSCFVGK